MFVAGAVRFHIRCASIRLCALSLAWAATFDSMITPLTFQSWSMTTAASAPPHELMEACSVLPRKRFPSPEIFFFWHSFRLSSVN
jgi:hypothetical protein